MTATIGLPQFIWILHTLILLCIHASKHGQHAEITYDGVRLAIFFSMQFAVLWWGGFF